MRLVRERFAEELLVDASRSGIRATCEAPLRRLGVDAGYALGTDLLGGRLGLAAAADAAGRGST